jgi:TRAP-type C4-dicarboxylate transport system permease large subunit
MGIAGAVALAAGFRLLNWEIIKKITWETVRVSSMILLLFALARIMGSGIGLLRVPDQLIALAASLGLGKYFILGGIYLVYLIGGMLMEYLALLVITLPITFPLLVSIGFDPIWGGVTLNLLGALALMTPPVGLGLYVVQGLRPEYKFGEIAMGTLPFVFVVLIVILIVTIFPQLATFLPGLMM